MNILNRENVEDVNLKIDALYYVINRMFPNIQGGIHFICEGTCANDMTDVAPSRIIAWDCVHQKPTAQEIMDAWSIVEDHYNRINQAPEPVEMPEVEKASASDLAVDPSDN